MTLAHLPLISGLFLVVALACSSGDEKLLEQALDDGEVVPAEARLRLDEFPLIKGPVSPDGLQAIFGTPDLGVGENRVGFVLTSPKGLVRAPAATVSSLFFPDEDSEGEPRQTALAVFRPWPYGTRGLYTTRLTFDRPGRWGININATSQDGPGGRAMLFFEVADTPSAPAVGSPAVISRSKTLDDVASISDLTTGSLRDPDLYQITIADAVTSGLPTVIVMASPAFCTNAVCGPQVQALQQLKNRYKGQANFIHVDLYDNPEEIQGDLDRGIISPTVIEWGLPSTEWSFVIDRDSNVAARFESFATLEELEQALLDAL